LHDPAKKKEQPDKPLSFCECQDVLLQSDEVDIGKVG
jgi:hypothetical protein